MRYLTLLPMVLCSGTAFAQYASAPMPPSTAGPAASFGLNAAAPVDAYQSVGSGITPTMVRERAERTARIYARYPGLKAQVEQVRDSRGYAQAQRVYDAAEKKARRERPAD